MPAKLLLVAALVCLASAKAVEAAPVITSVSGPVAAGQHLTILGTGFGAKPVAPPKKWDTFENGADGATLKSVDATWQDYKLDGGLRYSATAPHQGSLCLGRRNTSGEQFTTNYFTYGPGSKEIYISYWWKVVPTPGSKTIIKMTRMNSSKASGGGGVYNGAGATTVGGTYDLAIGAGPYCAHSPDQTTEAPCASNWDNTRFKFPPTSKWFRVDFYKKLGTPGLADGAIKLKLYGTSTQTGLAEIDNPAVMTVAAGQSFLMDTVILGTMDGSAAGHDYWIYIDDLYVDTTQARVEICDTPSWAQRTHCEVQPASAWSSTSATVTVNRGAFGATAGAWLFVIEAAGAVSAGHPISFGGSPTADAAPRDGAGKDAAAASDGRRNDALVSESGGPDHAAAGEQGAWSGRPAADGCGCQAAGGGAGPGLALGGLALLGLLRRRAARPDGCQVHIASGGAPVRSPAGPERCVPSRGLPGCPGSGTRSPPAPRAVW